SPSAPDLVTIVDDEGTEGRANSQPGVPGLAGEKADMVKEIPDLGKREVGRVAEKVRSRGEKRSSKRRGEAECVVACDGRRLRGAPSGQRRRQIGQGWRPWLGLDDKSDRDG
ncbi:hypothetical protein Dimus_008458, partial [Dionaea muscipula]